MFQTKLSLNGSLVPPVDQLYFRRCPAWVEHKCLTYERFILKNLFHTRWFIILFLDLAVICEVSIYSPHSGLWLTLAGTDARRWKAGRLCGEIRLKLRKEIKTEVKACEVRGHLCWATHPGHNNKVTDWGVPAVLLRWDQREKRAETPKLKIKTWKKSEEPNTNDAEDEVRRSTVGKAAKKKREER